MHARQFAFVGAALAASMCAQVASSLAKPVKPVVISKRVDPMVRYVSYADLSLTSREGKRLLIHRVYEAVDEVCPVRLPADPVDGTTDYDRHDCQDGAWAGARPQIRKAIRAASFGAPLVMTIGIAGARR
jgi:UrcA family protein